MLETVPSEDAKNVNKHYHSSSVKKRLLLVDDTDAVRRVVGSMLRIQGGFDVDPAANGAVARDMLSKNRYDVLLVDLNMPVMNGIELYRCIEEEYPEVATRVVFISADTPGPQARSFFAKVNRPFLSKPFAIEAVMNAFKSCTDSREAESC